MTAANNIKELFSPLVIYHADCSDGFGAAWVFHHLGKLANMNFEFHAAKYGEPTPDVVGRDVYFVDFCLQSDAMKSVAEMAASVTLIDHHPLALQVAHELQAYPKNNIYYNVDADNSGAVLAWKFWVKQLPDYFEDKPMPTLLAHIEDRDLWRFKMPLTRKIMAFVQAQDQSFSAWDELMKMEGSELAAAATIGEQLLRSHMKDCKNLIRTNRRIINLKVSQGGEIVNIPLCNAPGYMASDIGNIMSAEFWDGENFAATYYDTEHLRVFSLRSAPNGMDVNKVAKFYGGGGHVHAAGFSVSRSHPLAKV